MHKNFLEREFIVIRNPALYQDLYQIIEKHDFLQKLDMKSFYQTLFVKITLGMQRFHYKLVM
jgi:hypothetical protein